jgi:hypothetical protein
MLFSMFLRISSDHQLMALYNFLAPHCAAPRADFVRHAHIRAERLDLQNTWAL